MRDDILLRVIAGRASAEEAAATAAWRRKSPENERRFREIAVLVEWATKADRLRRPRLRPSAAELVRQAASGEGSRRSRGGPGQAVRWQRWLRVGAYAAAAILVFLGVRAGLQILNPPPSFRAKEFVTGPREAANVVLTDGTVIRLAGESRLHVIDRSHERSVALTGRAYFAVAHDPDRPFTVKLAGGDVRVLGTRFAIDASTDDLRVVVVEGTVSLVAAGTQMDVGASEMARVIRGTALPVVRVPDPARLASWIGNFLAFQDTPLSQAAKELERAYDLRIEIRDSSLARRTVTAWFTDWEAHEVIEVICVVANARCDTSGATVRMEPNPWDDR